jgi:enamine deaminase RidA (YjgF/YER057c/UK114 family)
MKRELISSGSEFEDKIGYSRAVVQGDWVFVSGTTGYDYSDMSISDAVVEQAEQCLLNIKSTLEKANASLADIVRITYIVADASEFEQCFPALQKYLGTVKPAATMFEAKLLDEKMKIEIQVTALKS